MLSIWKILLYKRFLQLFTRTPLRGCFINGNILYSVFIKTFFWQNANYLYRVNFFQSIHYCLRPEYGGIWAFCSWSSWTNGPKTSHIFQNFTESQRRWLFSKIDLAIIPANISLIKASKRSTNKKCETCSKLTIKTSERCPWRQSRAFIFNLEHISPIFLVLLLLTLTSKCFLR